jgi:hypothetical protein
MECAWCAAFRRGLARRTRDVMSWLVRRFAPLRIDVAIQDRRRAIEIERALERAARRRSRALGFVLPPTLAILVDPGFDADECDGARLDVVCHADGSRRYLLRLALAPWGQTRAIDDLVADQNDLLVALLLELSGARLRPSGRGAAGVLPAPSPIGTIPSEKGETCDDPDDEPEPRHLPC